MTRTLILGGARSGKSAYAEQLLAASDQEVIYIATGQARDIEMQARIEHHQQRRPVSWQVVEEPLALAAVLLRWCAPGRVVLVDCLTLWLSNLLLVDSADYPDVGLLTLPQRFHNERGQFLDVLDEVGGDLILVSNEVGLGIVPNGALSRCFVDEAGRLNQVVAQRCERVVLVVAGLPLQLKDES